MRFLEACLRLKECWWRHTVSWNHILIPSKWIQWYLFNQLKSEWLNFQNTFATKMSSSTLCTFFAQFQGSFHHFWEVGLNTEWAQSQWFFLTTSTLTSSLITCCYVGALTLAKWHWCIPLVDPLCSPGACGTALANKPEPLVTAETQGTAQLSASQTVHCAIYRVVWRAAVGRYAKRKETGKGINMHTDIIECNTHKNPIMMQDGASCCWGGEGLMCLQ